MDGVPIQNIYYLLCYALGHLQETKYAHVRSEDCTKVWDLLAKVMVSSSRQLRKRGIHRSYVDYEERRIRPRGKILFTDDIRRPQIGSASVPCRFDELSADVLPNQIIGATIRRLQRHPDLKGSIVGELSDVAPYWTAYSEIKICVRTFREIQLHRGMRHYRFVLSVCEMIYRQSLPTEESGVSQFRDFLRDETTMGLLFERFVFNFLKKELRSHRVRAPKICWALDDDQPNVGSIKFLPEMRTDIVLESDTERVIIDCKFYREALQRRFETSKFNSSNLYQLFAYLKNQEVQPGWEEVKGMLLYPTNGECFDETVKVHGHEIRIASIDLNQEWQTIAEDLLRLFRVNAPKPESKKSPKSFKPSRIWGSYDSELEKL